MHVKSFHRQFLAIAFCFFSSICSAESALRIAVDDFINFAISTDGVGAVTDPDVLADDLSLLYERLEGGVAPTLEQVKDFAKSLPDRKVLDKEATRKAFWSLVASSSESNWGERQSLAIMLLHPYVKDSGVCVAKENTPGVHSCSFMMQPREADIAFKVGGKLIEIDPESELAYILSLNPVGGVSTTDSSALSVSNITDGAAEGNQTINIAECYGYDYFQYH